MTRHVQNIAILLLLVGYFVACAHSYNPPPSLPAAEHTAPIAPAVVETKGKVDAIKPPLAAATQIAPKLTPQNIDKERDPLLKQLSLAWNNTLAAINSAKALETKAEASDKANAASFEREKKKDAALEKAAETIEQQNGVIADKDKKIAEMNSDFVHWLVGAAMFVCFLVAATGGFFVWKGDWLNGGGMIAGGLVGLGVGIAALTMEHFFFVYEKPIGIGLCIVALCGLVLGVYLAYRRLHDGAVSIVKGVQAGIGAGAVDMVALGPVLKAVETPWAGKALVDRHARSVPEDAPQHELPTMSINDNAGNLAWTMPGGA